MAFAAFLRLACVSMLGFYAARRRPGGFVREMPLLVAFFMFAAITYTSGLHAGIGCVRLTPLWYTSLLEPPSSQIPLVLDVFETGRNWCGRNDDGETAIARRDNRRARLHSFVPTAYAARDRRRALPSRLVDRRTFRGRSYVRRRLAIGLAEALAGAAFGGP